MDVKWARFDEEQDRHCERNGLGVLLLLLQGAGAGRAAIFTSLIPYSPIFFFYLTQRDGVRTQRPRRSGSRSPPSLTRPRRTKAFNKPPAYALGAEPGAAITTKSTPLGCFGPHPSHCKRYTQHCKQRTKKRKGGGGGEGNPLMGRG